MKKLPPAFWAAARIVIGIIFTYAGFTKLTSPMEDFRGMIANYQVIPYDWTTWVALILPWFELVAGFFMIVGYLPRLSAAVTGAMCLMFLLVIGASNALLDEGMKDCGCFGANSPIHLNVYEVFAMDFINFILCIALFRMKEHPFSIDRLLNK